MKKLILAVVFAVVFCVPAFAVTPITFTVPIHQATFQWRAWWEYPAEGASPTSAGPWKELYQNYDTTIECTLSGRVIHTYYEYSPVVEQLQGETTVYVLNAGLWIEHEGTIMYKYPPYYGDHWIVNYFRGYLDFDGTPADDTFEHGVAYQWVYLAATEQDGGILPYAKWDSTMDMWLLGYQIYLWDTNTFTQTYTTPFNFIEPVPASNYNPLNL